MNHEKLKQLESSISKEALAKIVRGMINDDDDLKIFIATKCLGSEISFSAFSKKIGYARQNLNSIMLGERDMTALGMVGLFENFGIGCSAELAVHVVEQRNRAKAGLPKIDFPVRLRY